MKKMMLKMMTKMMPKMMTKMLLKMIKMTSIMKKAMRYDKKMVKSFHHPTEKVIRILCLLRGPIVQMMVKKIPYQLSNQEKQQRKIKRVSLRTMIVRKATMRIEIKTLKRSQNK